MTLNINDEVNVFQFHEVIHGTYKDVMEPIMKTGLCRMARTNIHMGIGLPGKDGVISGMRFNCEVVVEVNISQAAASGVKFFKSENNVVLSPGLGNEGYLPPDYFRSVYFLKSGKYAHQKPIRYLCVYDLEANCLKDGTLPFNETVELPIVVVDTLKNEVVHEFHTYIKPTTCALEPFCTELCGITNEMVSGESVPIFKDALSQLHTFLEKSGILKEEFVLVSCGDYDGNQLKRECEFKDVFRPNYLKRWINLKKVHPSQQ